MFSVGRKRLIFYSLEQVRMVAHLSQLHKNVEIKFSVVGRVREISFEE
jgi:hypothetical protein